MSPARIVTGFDDTPSGFDALALGRQLAETMESELLVVHTYAPPVMSDADIVFEADLEARVVADASARLHAARSALEGFAPCRELLHASAQPARGLHEVAEREEATLIVVGSTHRHGAGRVVLGGTADRLFHGSSLPVVVAPAGWREVQPSAVRTIGVGYDGTPESGEALAAAVALAGATGAELRAVAVFEPPNPANPLFAVTSHGYHEICDDLRDALRRKVEEALKWVPFLGVVAHGEVVDGHATDVLADRSETFDLLAVGSRGWGALRAVMLGTHSRELASRSRCPLLVVPRGAGEPLARLAIERGRAGVH